jgi:2,3-bisphosphoglycerate-dependent phosphoglycerate mutase
VTTLYLVRHGETEWNREGRVQGHLDPPLNQAGRAQALGLARRLADVAFDAAYSSDSQRAHLTAEIVLAERRVPIVMLPGLRERFLGRWEGVLAAELPTSDPAAWRAWLGRPRDWAPHGGESEVELERRVTAALDGIVAAHPDQTILVVSHGGAIRATLHQWLDHDVHQVANCAAYVLDARPTGKRLVAELSCDVPDRL